MYELNVDVKKLSKELSEHIEGEVRFDNGSRALYATDASNYRQVPIGVVIPKNKDDVIKTINICRKYNAPILSRGGGTSLAGQCCNTAVVLDFTKYMNKIIEINGKEKFARVQPGLILDTLRKETEKINLTFGPDPATHNHCTFGGMIGNNSCGIHSVLAGKTVDNVLELEVLTYDGIQMTVTETTDEEYQKIISEPGRKADIYKKLKEIIDKNADKVRSRYPKIPRRVSGYNLDDLLPENNFDVAKALVGTESTCVVILEAKVKLVPWPSHRKLVVLGYPDIFETGRHIPEVLKYKPMGLEGMDDLLVQFMKQSELHLEYLDLLPEGKGWLLVEFGGDTKEEAEKKAEMMTAEIKKKKDAPSIREYDNKMEETYIWEIRESGLGATAHIPGEPESWPGWEDSAIAPEHVGDYLKDIRELYKKYNYKASLYGHFGQGCIHTRIPFDLQSEKGVDKYRKFIDEASDLCIKYNGSFSGEHGDGQARGELLAKMYGEDLVEAFRQFKSAWDPEWKMNPGKVIDPYPIDANLRLGAGYHPWEPETNFKFPKDKGKFSDVSLRCVGVGKCRRLDGEVMCPSYMVTLEEKHSTRGRARLLYEMLNGEIIKDKWRSEEVKEALDLCLSCKGCKNDCPVDVDMATYKSEFFSHYYEGKFRPRTAYSFGLIYWISKVGSSIPSITNFVTQTPGLKNISKFIAGMPREREIPKFAKQTFRKWWEKEHKPVHQNKNGKQKVLLWPDTFNNNFHPEVIKAAVTVLESEGYYVEIPHRSLCCGRPLYDFGMLDLAKHLLDDVLFHLKDDIDAGVPLVGLEPSCIAVFRDELIELFPENKRAQKLSKQSFMLSEFISQKLDEIVLPSLNRKAVVQHHCHHYSIMGFSEEEEILKEMGLDAEFLKSTCCGMAGSFGFEKEKYDVSVKCAEQKLIPAVNKADADTLILADGFSCREQIEQLTGRTALNFSEVYYMAIQNMKELKNKEVHDRTEKIKSKK